MNDIAHAQSLTDRATWDYVLLHLAAHLADMGDRERLCRLLIDNVDYFEAKYQHFRSDAFYLNDINRAIRLFGELASAPDLLTFISLTFAKVVVTHRTQSYTIDDLPTLIELNLIDEAHGIVALQPNAYRAFEAQFTLYRVSKERDTPTSIDLATLQNAAVAIPTVAERVSALRKVLDLVYEVDAVEAKPLLNTIQQVIPQISDRVTRETNYSDLVRILGRHGQTDAALVIADRLETDFSRAYALRDIAGALSHRAGFTEACQIAAKIRQLDMQVYVWAVMNVVDDMHFKNDDHWEALLHDIDREVTAIDDDYLRAKALILISRCPSARMQGTAQAYLERGAVSDRLASPIQRADILCDAVIAAATFSTFETLFDRALQALDQIADQEEKDRLLDHFADQLLWFSGAVDQRADYVEKVILKRVTSSEVRTTVLSSLVSWFISEERFDDALDRAQRISQRTTKETLLAEIAVGCAKTGRWQQAVGIAQELPDLSLRAKVLRQVAVYQLRSGHTEGLSLFQQAERLAHSGRDDIRWGIFISKLVHLLADAKEPLRATQIVELITNLPSEQAAQVELLRHIARVMSETGTPQSESLLERAEQIAARFQNQWSQVWYASDLAIAYARQRDTKATHQYQLALQQIKGLDNPNTRARAFIALAEALEPIDRVEAVQLVSYAYDSLTATEFWDNPSHEWVRVAVMGSQLGIPSMIELLEWLEKAINDLSDKTTRQWLQTELAFALIGLQHYTRASDVISKIESPAQQVALWRQLGIAVYPTDESYARQCLQYAYQLAREQLSYNVHELIALTLAAVKTNDTDLFSNGLEAFQAAVVHTATDDQQTLWTLMSVAFAEAGNFKKALTLWDGLTLDHALNLLCDYAPSLSRQGVGLPLQALSEAVRIGGWIRDDCRQVYEVLSLGNQAQPA